MFKKIVKIVLGAFGAFVLAALLGYAYITFSLEKRINKVYAFDSVSLTLPSDQEALVRGGRLYQIRGCEECHGADLGGKLIFDEPMVGTFYSANITYGEGGLPKDYLVEDWVNALRHGIGKNGKPLLIMPSHETFKMSDNDIAAIIAFCLSQKPVNRVKPELKVGPLGKVLTALDKITLLSAEKIDHTFKAPAVMLPEVSVAYGQYLAVACTGCHNKNFKGGESPIPGGKPVADITSTGNIGKWSADQFVKTLRTGVTPSGKQLNNADMPWQMTKSYTDTELKALHLYLTSLK